MMLKKPNFYNLSSPNFRERKGKQISMIVIHYTDMPSAEESLQRLTDPHSEVSAHYLIDRDGTVYSLVSLQYAAWHAGLSYWMGERNVNDKSIGIELQNRGHTHGYEDFTGEQMSSLNFLLHQIRLDFTILPNSVIGHSDVAPSRKSDPGYKFDWRLLARHGHQLWPPLSSNVHSEDHEELLHIIGYDPECTLVDKVKAFQLRFSPKNVTGELDGDTIKRMNGMLDLYRIIYEE